ncbi:MAG: hypothetical protein GY861_27590 [bacterium]|nr:hypothetical protein [bacterium]
MKQFMILLIIIFQILVISGCGSDKPEVKEDPLLLWKSQSNQQIVFTSNADSETGELYLMDKSGKITRLTNNNLKEDNPALSRDGTKLAFNKGKASGFGDTTWTEMTSWEIFVMDLATKRVTQLTDNNVVDAHADWSPDGKKLVFTSFGDSKGNPTDESNILVINADGTGLKQLTNVKYEDSDPEWSPDGTMIAFKSTRNTKKNAREEIYIMDSDGSNIKRLTTTYGWQSDHDPSWSPDSKSIAFNRFEGSRPWTDIVKLEILQNNFQEIIPWNAHTVDLDGNIRKLTNAKHMIGLPVYSADGSKILYVSLEFILSDGVPIGAYHRLMLSNTDGSDIQQLIPDDRHTPTLEYSDW